MTMLPNSLVLSSATTFKAAAPGIRPSIACAFFSAPLSVPVTSFAWREPLALQLEGLDDIGCFERHQQVRVGHAPSTGTVGVTYEGPHIMLDAVTYRTLGRSEAGR